MGESCLESFQDAQDCLLLTLADAADRDLFELGPDLLDLGAQGATRGGGFDQERALITGKGLHRHSDELRDLRAHGLASHPDRLGSAGMQTQQR
jgi:hypothetical protein